MTAWRAAATSQLPVQEGGGIWVSVGSLGLIEAGGQSGLEERAALTVLIRFASTQLLAFLQGLFTFYHHGYELAKDFSDFKTELTISIQNVSVCVDVSVWQRKLTHTLVGFN